MKSCHIHSWHVHNRLRLNFPLLHVGFEVTVQNGIVNYGNGLLACTRKDTRKDVVATEQQDAKDIGGSKIWAGWVPVKDRKKKPSTSFLAWSSWADHWGCFNKTKMGSPSGNRDARKLSVFHGMVCRCSNQAKSTNFVLKENRGCDTIGRTK